MATDYARPDVPIEPLPAVAQKIKDSLDDHRPGGGTPTLPALAGAVQYATSLGASHPDHKTIVVLATDGAPERLQLRRRPASRRGRTGLRRQSVDSDLRDRRRRHRQLERDRAGGRHHAGLRGLRPRMRHQAFLDAMNQIRGISLACDYAIPLPQGRPPNFSQVNFYFTPTGQPEQDHLQGRRRLAVRPEHRRLVLRQPDQSDADPGVPRELRAAKGGGGSVKIEVGCDSIAAARVESNARSAPAACSDLQVLRHHFVARARTWAGSDGAAAVHDAERVARPCARRAASARPSRMVRPWFLFSSSRTSAICATRFG